jgi:serine O-acetyltransferase
MPLYGTIKKTTQEVKNMDTIEKQIETVVDSILEDYRQNRSIDKLDIYNQLDKNLVIDILGKLIRLVVPGYSRDRSYRIYNARHNLSMLMEDVMFNLSRQVALVCGCSKERSEEMTLDFLRQIPQVRALVQTDVEAALDGDPAATGTDEIIFCYPGLYAIIVYRLANVLSRMGVPMLPRIMTEYAHSATGIDIHPGATIGHHFFIDHGTGIVVGETTTIGNFVKIYQGVTLGGLSTRGGQALRGLKRHPSIEDNVTIYANASILGGNTVIGKNSVIGANVFITESIPECTTVTLPHQELQLRARKCPGCGGL